MKYLSVFALVVFSTVTHANTLYKPPQQDNAAYVLMDYDTGAIIAEKNIDTPLPPASLTKMMTSYIVEQRLINGLLKEDTPINVSPTAWCKGSSAQSCMYVPVNTSAPAIDMLRGIIVQSGNDASIAVAEHIAGSEMAFAMLMNEEAQKLGMKQTRFVNSTGMPADDHLSTARDLALLARAVIRDSGDYYKIYAEKEFTYNGITQGNRNTLIGTDPTVDGLKTGHTAQAGYCLAASSSRDDMRLIAIVLGAPSMQARSDQARELFAFGFGNFKNVVKATQGQSVAQVPVRFGKSATVEGVTQAPLKVLANKLQAEKINTTIELNPNISAPISQGQEIGRLIAYIDTENGKQAVAQTPIVAKEMVAQKNWFGRTLEAIIAWFKR